MSDFEHLEGASSRGYLPHLDPGPVIQFVTWRLADALPVGLVAQWRAELAVATGAREAMLRQRVEKYLDRGVGEGLLGDPRAASIVVESLKHFDGQRYRLLAWVVMPNHVHVLVELLPGQRLGRLVQTWKSFTAKAINQALGREGPVWFREYHDRWVRDDAHRAAAVEYIHQNPVKAGLVERAEMWTFSSAAEELD